MKQGSQPELIRAKIKDCGQVLIYRINGDQHKQALAFKKDFEVDDKGQLSFILSGNFAGKHIDTQFPVEFFFYKKGKPFYITAKGLALAVESKDQDSNTATENEGKTLKVQVDFVELVDLRPKESLPFSFNSFFGF